MNNNALSGFNNVLLKFFEQLLKWYPDVSDLKLLYRGMETLKKYNPRMVLDQFMYFAGPYYVQIFNKEESFFLDLNNIMNDPNVAQVIESEGESQDSFMQRMVIFKELFSTMTDDRKKYVWKMFGALLKVGALASTLEDYKIIISYVEENPKLFE